MKYLYILTTLTLCMFVDTVTAQNYALVEHFTNTHCPLCTSRNPQLFEVVNSNSPRVHHISYHPPYPYNACIFYQANTEGNQARADLYTVFGSPSAYVGGERANAGGSLLSEEKVLAQIDRTMVVEVNVEESEASTRSADQEVRIKVKSVGDAVAGDYRLFAAIVEKEIAYNSPNGESTHHNVFRKMLPDNEGEPIELPAGGEEIELVYNYDFESGWQQDEIYVVAFVQNMSDLTITGSGTRFDNLTTSNKNIRLTEFKVRNNLTSDQITLILPESLRHEAEVNLFAANGQLVQNNALSSGKRIFDIAVDQLNAGIYFIDIVHPNNQFVRKKFIKK